MSKRISLVVTYDTETDRSVVDGDATSILFAEGPCWDDDLQRWVEESTLVKTVKQRLEACLVQSSELPLRNEAAPAETKFIELALNIIDPDGAWDLEETLEFGDAARVHLSEYPITNWEIEGTFALVAQFVHDWVLDEARVTNRATDVSPSLAASLPAPRHLADARTAATRDNGNPSFDGLASLETEDPLSGARLRIVLGEFEGVPTLALFVGEDEEPILIDRSALNIAIEQWWGSRNDGDRPAFSFHRNIDRELEVIELEIDI